MPPWHQVCIAGYRSGRLPHLSHFILAWIDGPNVRFRGYTGKHVLVASISPFDPFRKSAARKHISLDRLRTSSKL